MALNDPTDTDAEEQIERDRAFRIKESAKERKDDIEWLMENVQGRRFMARLFDFTGIHRTTFRPNSEMAFLEGQRNVGLVFLADVMEFAAPKWVAMLNEEKARNQRKEVTEHERSNE